MDRYFPSLFNHIVQILKYETNSLKVFYCIVRICLATYKELDCGTSFCFVHWYVSELFALKLGIIRHILLFLSLKSIITWSMHTTYKQFRILCFVHCLLYLVFWTWDKQSSSRAGMAFTKRFVSLKQRIWYQTWWV